MLTTFFAALRSAGVPVTLREYLTLLEAMDKDLAGRRVEDFYYLARAALVKDERHLDRFDRVFGHVFKGLDLLADGTTADIPAEWLKKLAEKHLTEEEKRDAAAALVKRMEDLSRKEAELESIKNQFKGEKSRIEADIEANKNLVRDGYVFREINCRETKNFETERLEIVRLDTMEMIEDRRLHNHELQMTLPGMA
jgi:uncharacterized protein with von Willebrand factor type A (vWA) domain